MAPRFLAFTAALAGLIAMAFMPSTGWAQGSCGAPNVYIVLDQSGSMDDIIDYGGGSTELYCVFNPGKCKTKWDVARAALTTVVNANPQFRWGLITFSDTAKTRVALGDNRGGAIVNWLGGARPDSGTNLIAGMNQAKDEYVNAVFPQDPLPQRSSYVLFLTDGQAASAEAQVAAMRNLTSGGVTHDVKTFVVGFGKGVDGNVLSKMALAGGVPRNGNPPYYQADDQVQLNNVMNQIVSIAGGEVCNGVDDDCDGQIDEGIAPIGCDGICGKGQKLCQAGQWTECSTGGPGGECTVPGAKGVCAEGEIACAGSGASTCESKVQPGAEVCDGLDNDCDGEVDEEVTGQTCDTGRPGACAAGIMQCQNGTMECVQANGVSGEICNGLDDDCDGAADNNPQEVGTECDTGIAGACATGTVQCVAGSPQCQPITTPTPEICDNIDNDCDGKVDNGVRNMCGECAPEVIEDCNGLDDNCDGQVDENVTRSCTTVCGTGAQECFSGIWGECSAGEPGEEQCDGLDNDCDGETDEGDIAGVGEVCETGGAGECSTGVTVCVSGVLDCQSAAGPGGEVCNGKDDNCDGKIDEGNPGGGDDCVTGLPGVCARGKTYCCVPELQAAGVKCDIGQVVCVQREKAKEETCDRLDNNCDGKIDEGTQNACGGCGPLAEACNLEDDDCDGIVDEESCTGGAVCINGQCRSPGCGTGECGPGEKCATVEGQQFCIGLCDDVTCAREKTCDAATGNCVDLCDGVSCGAGQTCFQGECGTDSCSFTGCDTGKICLNNKCVDDPCTGKECASGQFCSAGECQGSCADISCALDQTCSRGKCEVDPCFGVRCATGQACVGGACEADPCDGVSCEEGLICAGGECHGDPCSVITCPANQKCVNLECVSTLEPESPAEGNEGGEGGECDFLPPDLCCLGDPECTGEGGEGTEGSEGPEGAEGGELPEGEEGGEVPEGEEGGEGPGGGKGGGSGGGDDGDDDEDTGNADKDDDGEVGVAASDGGTNQLELVNPEGCGCRGAAQGGNAGAGIWLLVLGLAGWVARRRR